MKNNLPCHRTLLCPSVELYLIHAGSKMKLGPEETTQPDRILFCLISPGLVGTGTFHIVGCTPKLLHTEVVMICSKRDRASVPLQLQHLCAVLYLRMSVSHPRVNAFLKSRKYDRGIHNQPRDSRFASAACISSFHSCRGGGKHFKFCSFAQEEMLRSLIAVRE